MKTSTDYETSAINAAVNLSDAHCRVTPDEETHLLFQNILDNLEEIVSSPNTDLEESFLNAFNQFHRSRIQQPILTSYSVSCLVLSFSQWARGKFANIIFEEPSFDNIRDLLATTGMQQDYLPEGTLREHFREKITYNSIVWLTIPNNPTGHRYTLHEVERIALECKRSRALLAIDCSFRGFSEKSNEFNFADLLKNIEELSWVVFEDTGKLLPLWDLKIGFCYCSANIFGSVQKENRDLLLAPSPFVLALNTHFMLQGRIDVLRKRISENRRNLLEGLGVLEGNFPISASEAVPLVWIDCVTSQIAIRVLRSLESQGIHLLPGRSFFSQSEEGSRFIRIALNRDVGIFCRAIPVIQAAFADAMIPPDI